MSIKKVRLYDEGMGVKLMKDLRLFVITMSILTIALFFLSFYFLGQNLANPVQENRFLPFKSVYIYHLETSGEVGINFLHLILYSLLFSLPIFFILKHFSSFISQKLEEKGRL